MKAMFQVAVREPMAAWPRWKWIRITRRPIGRDRAVALANAQDTHAAVNVWLSAEKVYDNGKALRVTGGES